VGAWGPDLLDKGNFWGIGRRNVTFRENVAIDHSEAAEAIKLSFGMVSGTACEVAQRIVC